MTSRFYFVEGNQLLPPGNCVSCGGGPSIDSRRFIDLGITVEFHGAIYLCTYCMAAVAEDINYVPKADVSVYKVHADRAKEENIQLCKENEALRHVMAVILRPIVSDFGDADSIIGRIVSDVQDASEQSKDDRKSSGTAKGSNKPSSLEKSGSVRAATENPFSE